MATEDSRKQKKSKGESGSMMKVLLLYAGAMVMMTLVAVVLVVMVIGPKLAPSSLSEIQPETPQHQTSIEAKGLVGNIVDLGEFIVNPAGTEMKRFLVVEISAAVSSAGVKTMISAAENDAQVKHIINSTMAKKTLADLQGEGGIEALGKDISNALNGIFGDGMVKQIFFKKFIIQ